jgi:hypothetical protein
VDFADRAREIYVSIVYLSEHREGCPGVLRDVRRARARQRIVGSLPD